MNNFGYTASSPHDEVDEKEDDARSLASKLHPAWSVSICAGCCFNIALFYYSQLTDFYSIKFREENSGLEDTLETYSVVTGIDLLWSWGEYDASNYFFAATVTVFSLIWPHVKTLLTIALAVYPMPRTRRGKVLEILSLLGPLSLYDAFITVIMVEAFNISVESFTFQVVVESGIYWFCVAILASIFLSDLLRWLHVTEEQDGVVSTERSLPRALAQHAKDVKRFGVPGTVMSPAVTCGLVVAFVFILWGFVVNAYHFRYKILFLDIDNKYFSLAEGVQQMGDSDGNDPDGNRLVAAVYLMFVGILPLVWILGLLLLWLVPMRSISLRSRAHFIVELMGAMSGGATMLVTIFFSFLCFRNWTEAFFRDYVGECEAVPGVQTSECFYIQPYVNGGYFITLIGTLLTYAMAWTIATYFTKLASPQAADDAGEETALIGVTPIKS